MKNIEISNIFENIATLLQVRGEPSFRFRSYEKAARIISDLTVEASELIESGKFQDIQGIGKTIEEKTREILDTGTCKAYEKLIDEMGVGVLELLDIQGIGPKTANRLYTEYEIRNIDQLANALEDGTLKQIKGLGKKTLVTIGESLEFLSATRGSRIISMSIAFAEKISEILKNCSAIHRFDITGDLRRKEEECHGIQFVIDCSSDIENTKEVLIKALQDYGFQVSNDLPSNQENNEKSTLIQNVETIHFYIDNDFPVMIYLSSTENYEATLFITTPSNEHLEALPLDNLTDSYAESSRYLEETKNHNETDIFEKLGMSFIPPELRQYSDTVSLAIDDNLPTLLEFDDMRGDLHSHTEWSDGRNTMNEMVATAIKIGLEYFAITDHSVSSTVANGLDEERLLQQIEHVQKKDSVTEGIKLLAGSEVDIRRDGSLDYSDEVLAKLDIVVASVHSHFNISEADMTKRMISAIENPFVNIIGHPTGRLLGRRPMYPINIDEILAAAAEHNKIMEINGSPSRLDLGPEYVRKGKELGILFSINTDAHSIPQFERREYGVNVARRSGLTKDDVINTYTIERLVETLKHTRK
ncbi:PHP domain-containing protein [Candidatus Poribacteria bacterium]|nr:PHP domain-containing protein [Candidatus Poribacteria bacterium]